MVSPDTSIDATESDEQNQIRCPASFCHRTYRSLQTLFAHVNVHLSKGDSIPQTFYMKYNRISCINCLRHYATNRRHICNAAIGSLPQPLQDTREDGPGNSVALHSSVDQSSSESDQPHVSLETDFLQFRKGSVIYRVPKASRIQAATALQCLIAEVCNSNSQESWKKLFSFPSQCLFKPKVKKRHQQNLSSIINKRIAAYLSLSSDIVNENVSPSYKSASTESRKHRANLAQKKIEKGDVKGAVRIISSDEQLSHYSDETLQKLKKKHPLTNPNREYLANPSDGSFQEAIQCDEKQVREAIYSFAPGSASGPDLLEPQHLKDFLSKSCGETANSLLKSLTRLCNLMLSGKVPEEVVPFLYGASLTALSKANSDIRPIAVGTVYRRLSSKIAARFGIIRAKDKLYPHQLGVGIRKGAEAIAHTVRNCINMKLEHNHPFVMMKVDFSNAFNTVRRDVVLTEVKNEMRELFPFMWQLYGRETNLFYGEHVIKSSEGMQQGDPIGPLGFSLAVNKLISNLKSEVNCWYLDDGCLIGTIEQINEDLRTILDHQISLGLILNINKCELFDPMSLCGAFGSDSLKQMPTINVHNATLLGTPLFYQSAEKIIQEKINTMIKLVDRLKDLDSHYGFYILKNCFSIPKFLYVLRTFPCFELPHKLLQFDDIQRTSLETILNCNITPESYDQAFLPVSMGGLGLRRAMDLALPAFLSSSNGVIVTTRDILPNCSADPLRNRATDLWRAKCQILDLPSRLDSQNAWDHPLSVRQFNAILNHTTDEKAKARLLSVSSPDAGCWLTSIPVQSLGLKLNNEQLRIAISLRLGIDICIPHKCKCGVVVEKDGTHGLSCRYNSGRTARHGEANDILRRALVSAGIPAVLEPNGLCRDDGKRPDGITLIPWSKGLPLIWDYTCVDTLASSNLHLSAKEGVKLAMNAEDRKRRKYECLTNAHIFCPFAMETLGAWGPDARRLTKAIGQRITERTGELRATFFLKQRLSLAVQRGNASSIISCIPSSRDFAEVNYL